MIHIEPVTSTLRYYKEGSFEDKSAFNFVCTLQHLDDTTVIIKAGLGILDRQTYREIKKYLIDQGYIHAMEYRHGKWTIRDR